ncbi:MAG TPA: NAD-dependent epimerase/dehydratase family protein [Deltaproteobacteria bacterium]|nr:NAD-dependent epimerase/dehydratase family protein [Deltaproteobacteria bacterium]
MAAAAVAAATSGFDELAGVARLSHRWNLMKVLVTGATGFIGHHVARRLVAGGHGVRALVRDGGKAERVLGPLGLRTDDFIVGEMTDAVAVARAFDGCDAVLHAAAMVSVTSGTRDFRGNRLGTETVVGGAVERGLETIFVSSMLAIFDPRRPMNDASPIGRSRTHYGRSKAECDRWVRARQAEGAPVGIVYPSGCVGPDDPGMSESVKAYRSFLRGTLRSEGGNQMVDVRDLAELIVRLLEDRTRGRVVAGGHFLDWDEFTRMLEEATGARIPRISAPGWLLRAVARSMDGIGRLSGRRMPMTGEGVEIATRVRPMEDSKCVRELGIVWRDPVETLRDLFQWFLDSGKLPPRAVPALRARC